jgi:SynChlorMet cassette protein ScmC
MTNANALLRLRSGYDLSLKDGSHWRLSADETCADWLARLGVILELPRCPPTAGSTNGLVPLFIARAGDGDGVSDHDAGAAPPAALGLDSRAGWTCQDRRIVRLWSHDEDAGVVCELAGPADDECLDYVRMFLALQPIYRRSMAAGGLLTHAALFEREGKGILLVAAGGRGKSTSSRRLPAPWRVLGDDAALVVHQPGRSKGRGTYWVHPFPTWSDYYWARAKNTWNVRHAVPLAGVFFLEQAEDDRAVAIGAGQAALRLTESAMQICELLLRGLDAQKARRIRMLLFDNACQLVRSIPAFVLHASLHGAFWEEMERALDGQA